MDNFKALGDRLTVVIAGASGGIGSAITEQLLAMPQVVKLHTLSRSVLPENLATDPKLVEHSGVDFTDEASIAQACETLKGESIDVVLVTLGVLHDEALGVTPEKSIRKLNQNNFHHVMQINALAPMLVAQQLAPLMPRDRQAVFAAISARVGSISDNGFGGWYSYRASKAALNMMLKNLAIELKRTKPELVVAGLHPGTVDTNLSEPFQKNVAQGKLFSRAQSAGYLLDVVNDLTAKDSGKIFAWDGQEIPA